MSQPRVTVLSLGGTIASTDARVSGVVPTLTSDDLSAAVPQLTEVADVSVVPFRQVPGAYLTIDDIALAREVTSLVDGGTSGVVVTQGTDTIEETAFVLDLLVDRDAPVVVTEAMRTRRPSKRRRT